MFRNSREIEDDFKLEMKKSIQRFGWEDKLYK
jgi:hypothetical protein